MICRSCFGPCKLLHNGDGSCCRCDTARREALIDQGLMTEAEADALGFCLFCMQRVDQEGNDNDVRIMGAPSLPRLVLDN